MLTEEGLRLFVVITFGRSALDLLQMSHKTLEIILMVCAEYHREGPLGANESITHAEVAHLRPREHSALTDKNFFLN